MGNFWLFQAVPQRFDFDGFLRSAATECDWLAAQHRKDMRVGDGVVLWRGKGADPVGAGAVGWARISSLPTLRADTSHAASYWLDQREAASPEYRVRLQIAETRPGKPLHYNILKHDRMLKDMGIFRQRQGSNFWLHPSEVERLAELWGR